MHERPLSYLVLACAAALCVACSGGGKSSSGNPDSTKSFITGVAAAGLPLAGGKVAALDATGTSVAGSVASDGTYQLDVTSRTPPFLVEVAGTAGGEAAILHAVATAGDLDQSGALGAAASKVVNVNPLTELATAYVFKRSPAQVFRDPSRSLTPATTAALASAAATVTNELAPLLTVYGFNGDPRTSPFTANGTGLDAALDRMRLSPVQDPSSGSARYELLIVTQTSPVVLDPAAPPSGPVIAFSSAEKVTADAAQASLSEIAKQLQDLAAKFATDVPAAATVRPLFDAAGFYHNGLGLEAYLSTVLLSASYVGLSIGAPAIESIAGPDDVTISVSFAVSGLRPWREVLRMKRSSGAWLIEGNHQLAQIAVNMLTRLIGPSNGGIEQFVNLFVSSSQLDPRIASVRVSGPGLPSPYLIMVQSDPSNPRVNLIFEGDNGHWDAFNTDRCGVIDTSYLSSACALTWSELTAGSTYVFTFLDSTDDVLGTQSTRLEGTPKSDAEWLAQKSSVFPLLTLTVANAVTMDNISSRSAGAPFTYGATEIATWSVASDPAVSVDNLYFWRWGAGGAEEHCANYVFGVTSTSSSCTWKSNFITTMAQVDLNASDVYGNLLANIANPDNPY